MARARNLKPGFFKNETLAECSPLARLLFAGLWLLADRAGRLEDRPKRIRAEVLPYDDGSVDDMLNELHQAGFILRYRVDGRGYIQVLNFSRHQNPHHREPESAIPAPGADEAGTQVNEGEPRESPGQALGSSRESPEQAPNQPITSRADSLNLIPDSLNQRKSSSAAASHAGASAHEGDDPPPPDDDPPSEPDDPPRPPLPPAADSPAGERARELAVLLRRWERARGKQPTGTNGHDPKIAGWVLLGLTDQELAEAYALAVADRDKNHDPASISPGFLDVFVQKLRRPQPARASPRRQTSAAQTSAWMQEAAAEIRAGVQGTRRTEIDMGTIDATRSTH